MEKKKRQRSPNFTPGERSLVLQVIKKYEHIVEDKNTDGITNREKDEAWENIHHEINSKSSVKRTTKQLKSFYENVKKQAKKDAARDKVERYKTGGGTYTPVCNEETEKILAILGNRASPLPNQFDSDAQYAEAEHTTDAATSRTNDQDRHEQEFAVQHVNQIVEEVETDSTRSDFNEHITAINLVVSSEEDGTTNYTIQNDNWNLEVDEFDDAENDARDNVNNPTVDEGLAQTAQTRNRAAKSTAARKNWTGRRRPVIKKPTVKVDAKEEGYKNFAASCNARELYFKRKMENEEKEHELRLKVLKAKEKFYSNSTSSATLPSALE